MTTTRPKSTSPVPSSGEGKNGTPSGFVLKLYQMVNGAPDDIVSWVPSGEAFRITDLSRLESDTLPSYFRHSRFQSLVRQLNFYNFRKINRERTFWVYYHPLFHRDHPDKLCELRRRTCPGFDGRRNKVPPIPAPPPRYTYDDINPKYQPHPKVTPGASGTGNKVSRSPSPSSSPLGGEPAGNESVRASTRLRGERNLIITENAVSEEEVSPVTSKKQKTSHRSSATAVTPATETPPPSAFHRTVSNISTETMVAPTEESEKYVADKLKSHIQSTSLLEGIVDCATTKSNSDSDDDDFHYYTSSTNRKKASKEEMEELLDHRYDVSEVSRNLDGICSDYAESIKPRGGRRGGRVGIANPVLQFGFEKPDNAYSGTKCDLFTYDYEEGEYIVEEDHQALMTSKKEDEVCGPTPKKVDAPRPSSPSSCPLLNGKIAQTCLDGFVLMPNTTTLERTVASAILSFCLATHPEDPDADIKLRVHLQRGPMLAREFDMYLMALLPSIDIGPKDRLQAWKSFSLNKLQHIIKALHDGCAPSSVERVAIKKCADCWFPEVAV